MRRRAGAPVRRWCEGVVGIPDDSAETTELMCAEPAPGDLGRVPEARDARVGEERGRDLRAGVAGVHRFPEHDHVQLRVRMSVEDVLSDPTGADAAGGSGWCDQKDERRLLRR